MLERFYLDELINVVIGKVAQTVNLPLKRGEARLVLRSGSEAGSARGILS